ncbi:MAG: hypothetical protein ACR2P5_02245 [Gammaproteobacteria bacterium]
MGEGNLNGLRYSPISPQTAKGGGTPPVCIPTLERRDELIELIILPFVWTLAAGGKKTAVTLFGKIFVLW